MSTTTRGRTDPPNWKDFETSTHAFTRKMPSEEQKVIDRQAGGEYDE